MIDKLIAHYFSIVFSMHHLIVFYQHVKWRCKIFLKAGGIDPVMALKHSAIGNGI